MVRTSINLVVYGLIHSFVETIQNCLLKKNPVAYFVETTHVYSLVPKKNLHNCNSTSKCINFSHIFRISDFNFTEKF